MTPEFDYYWTYLKTRWDRFRAQPVDDRGAVSLETILIAIGLVGLTVIIIGALIVRVTNESNEIMNG